MVAQNTITTADWRRASENEAIQIRPMWDNSNIGCEKQETADHTAVRKDTRSRTIRAKKRVYVQRYNNMPPSIRGHGYVSKTWDSVWKYWSIVQLKNWAIDNNPMPAITHEHTNVV